MLIFCAIFSCYNLDSNISKALFPQDEFVTAIRDSNSSAIISFLDRNRSKITETITKEITFTQASGEQCHSVIDLNYAYALLILWDKECLLKTEESQRSISKAFRYFIKEFLKSGAIDPNEIIGEVPLISFVIKLLDFETVKMFIEELDINLNPSCYVGSTPLAIATYKRDYDLIKYLLDRGAKVFLEDSKDINSGIPISYAFHTNDLKALEIFFDLVEDIDNKKTANGLYPSTFAAVKSRKEAINLMLSKGIKGYHSQNKVVAMYAKKVLSLGVIAATLFAFDTSNILTGGAISLAKDIVAPILTDILSLDPKSSLIREARNRILSIKAECEWCEDIKYDKAKKDRSFLALESAFKQIANCKFEGANDANELYKRTSKMSEDSKSEELFNELFEKMISLKRRAFTKKINNTLASSIRVKSVVPKLEESNNRIREIGFITEVSKLDFRSFKVFCDFHKKIGSNMVIPSFDKIYKLVLQKHIPYGRYIASLINEVELSFIGDELRGNFEIVDIFDPNEYSKSSFTRSLVNETQLYSVFLYEPKISEEEN